MYEIETDVPAPPLSHGNAKYPWEKMEVGNSFFVPGGSVDTIQKAGRAWADRNHGGKFICRKAVEDGLAGVRAWRIK